MSVNACLSILCSSCFLLRVCASYGSLKYGLATKLFCLQQWPISRWTLSCDFTPAREAWNPASSFLGFLGGWPFGLQDTPLFENVFTCYILWCLLSPELCVVLVSLAGRIRNLHSYRGLRYCHDQCLGCWHLSIRNVSRRSNASNTTLLRKEQWWPFRTIRALRLLSTVSLFKETSSLLTLPRAASGLLSWSSAPPTALEHLWSLRTSIRPASEHQ